MYDSGLEHGGVDAAVVVEDIRFVRMKFFSWWDTNSVFIADWGEIRDSFTVVVRTNRGAFTIAATGLDGRESGEGMGCADDEFRRGRMGVWVGMGGYVEHLMGLYQRRVFVGKGEDVALGGTAPSGY